jgi:septin family protein
MTMLQLIDENQQFAQNVLDALGELRNQGFNYHVVAVFGSQSTGKSTLLNRLFNTSFDVMNEQTRKQSKLY